MCYYYYCRIEHDSFTKSETQAFKQLCRVIVLDFLPFIESCLSVFFPEEKVQLIASSTVITSWLKETDSQSSSKKQVLMIGIDARKLAEPLRTLVPELFNEIEKEEMLKSMSNLQDLFGETKQPAANDSEEPPLLPVTAPDTTQEEEHGTENNDTSDETVAPSNDKTDVINNDPVLVTSDPPLTTTTTTVTASGWDDFAFDNNDDNDS